MCHIGDVTLALSSLKAHGMLRLENTWKACASLQAATGPSCNAVLSYSPVFRQLPPQCITVFVLLWLFYPLLINALKKLMPV